MADNRMTLLEMVQDILSDMNSDSVNSINDTTEALQVAQIVKSTYFLLISQMDRPWLGTTFPLESGTLASPTKMRMPEDVSKILWIKYDKRQAVGDAKMIDDVRYLKPKDFMDLVYRRNSDADNVVVITDSTNVPILIHDDRAPSYWTSFDDDYIYFDSYNVDVDSTLQSSKSVAHGFREPDWQIDDEFIADLPSHLFPTFLAEAKSTCMIRLKQTTDPKAEQSARQGKTRNQYAQWRQNGKSQGPNFGRK